MSYLKAAAGIPRPYVRLVRWAECVFIVPALLMLSSLPLVPRGLDAVTFAILATAILGAGLVWWGLRSPTRLAWWGALALAVAWSLNSVRVVAGLITVIANVSHGYYATSGTGEAMLVGSLVALLTTVAQVTVLFAWWMGMRRQSS